MKRLLVLTALLAGSAVPAVAQAGTGGFTVGDLYLHTTVWSGISSSDGAIVHIDPLTGGVTLFHDLATSGPTTQGLTYDPWRDRLLFFGGFVPNSIELWASDAAGNLTSLGLQTASGGARGLLTPRGDGVVYLLNPLDTGALSYLDAADSVHTLMNAAGTAPWSFALAEVNIQTLLYVPKTNSLVFARWGFTDPCAGIPANVTAIHRLDLSPDGTRVVGEACFWYDSHPSDWDGEPRGLSLGPDGDPVLVVGNGGGSSGPQQRIAWIDMETNTASPFATTDFTAQHRIVSGTYSSVLGKAIVHDSFIDGLRAYSYGQAGGGSILVPSGLSASSSSGERAALVEVAPTAYLTGLSSATGTVPLAAGGSQVLAIDVGPAFAGLPYLTLGSASGWTPGLIVDGKLLPLNYDAYLGHVLVTPNQVPLLASFGLLDGAGGGTTTFQLPPGSSPSYAGIQLHHATAVLDPIAGVVARTTNAVPVLLVP